MRDSSRARNSAAASPPRKGPPSEQTDEAPGLIDKDRVDVEREIPAEDNQPIEGAEPHQRPDPPAFED
ncbi:hypothetical protein KMZ68_13265 [Bradyrhizobium sediminis]|uniref:Uncharacterized protein n=1 Tax=Bradyrhizobium sediminis TaxID=2840469 RepID=A0A975NL33_9BRAD|nr:hypothetical protein [Bradyrhizobium sediminis]QWG16024.1 hypothetical protein KMZ68_13265 [Bradyrhizobium sediminis]